MKDTFKEWKEDNATRLGASLAFYSVLSLGPLLLIVVSIAGLVFGEEAAKGHLFTEISALVGKEGAHILQTALANSRSQADGFWATIIGLVTLMIVATGVFGELQDALNIIWKVKSSQSGLKNVVKKRLVSFAMVVTIGFLLLISLVVTTAISAFSDYIWYFLPEPLLQIVNLAVSFLITTLLFAMIFKILPDVHIRWKEVWLGAAITSVLFSLGKLGISLYLGHSALSSTYGAAGSLIIILVWVYYSTQILFLGAEFTQVHARYTKSNA